MAVWKCEKCGTQREGRCKPKKCASCDSSTFVKQQ